MQLWSPEWHGGCFLHSRERNLVNCLKPILKVRMKTVFQTHLLPFFDIIYWKVHRDGLTQKMSYFWSNMAVTTNLKETACFGNFTISFWIAHFKFYQILFGFSCLCFFFYKINSYTIQKKGKRKVQEVPQLHTAALPRHQEEEETDKSKQAQIEQTYEKH